METLISSLLAAFIGAVSALVGTGLQLRQSRLQMRAQNAQEFSQRIATAVESWWLATLRLQSGEALEIEQSDTLLVAALWLPQAVRENATRLLRTTDREDIGRQCQSLRQLLLDFVSAKVHV